ncbi:hypothetical protein AC481_07125 [miscellaneous Crenarchaeota group archaeon SMTZ-80]|nr:MAG: hypothetical protein AC481_07125 [miscellaneous Crenarchaeota group archaeon SMTZ-80]
MTRQIPITRYETIRTFVFKNGLKSLKNFLLIFTMPGEGASELKYTRIHTQLLAGPRGLIPKRIQNHLFGRSFYILL